MKVFSFYLLQTFWRPLIFIFPMAYLVLIFPPNWKQCQTCQFFHKSEEPKAITLTVCSAMEGTSLGVNAKYIGCILAWQEPLPFMSEAIGHQITTSQRMWCFCNVEECRLLESYFRRQPRRGHDWCPTECSPAPVYCVILIGGNIHSPELSSPCCKQVFGCHILLPDDWISNPGRVKQTYLNFPKEAWMLISRGPSDRDRNGVCINTNQSTLLKSCHLCLPVVWGQFKAPHMASPSFSSGRTNWWVDFLSFE